MNPEAQCSALPNLAQRYRSVRILLHIGVMLRARRNLRWHWRCIWREITEALRGKRP